MNKTPALQESSAIVILVILDFGYRYARDRDNCRDEPTLDLEGETIEFIDDRL